MNISFGAKLKIDENYGKNLPSHIDGQELKTLASQYETFIKNDKISSILIPDDLIVLSSKRHPQSFSVDLDIYDKNSTEPFQTTICVSKACKPRFCIQDLIFLTYQYIAFKYNVKQRFFEPCFEYINRATRELMNEKLKNNSDFGAE